MLNAEFSRQAAKFLEKMAHIDAKRIYDAIENLREKPFPSDVKRVENRWFENEKIFRIRIGVYRVLYTVNYDKRRILIVDIDKRPRVY